MLYQSGTENGFAMGLPSLLALRCCLKGLSDHNWVEMLISFMPDQLPDWSEESAYITCRNGFSKIHTKTDFEIQDTFLSSTIFKKEEAFFALL